jgi:hypothetical protein
MTRWRIHQKEIEPVIVAASCQPHVVETPGKLLIRRFACEPGFTCLCPCYLDALEFSRHYTSLTNRVCVVLREVDRLLLARTGPKRRDDD